MSAAMYRVWDEMNSSEKHGAMIDADDPEHAARVFAEEDTDGQCDGLYTFEGRELRSMRDGQPVSVRAPDGTLSRWFVGVVELAAVYDAVPR